MKLSIHKLHNSNLYHIDFQSYTSVDSRAMACETCIFMQKWAKLAFSPNFIASEPLDVPRNLAVKMFFNKLQCLNYGLHHLFFISRTCLRKSKTRALFRVWPIDYEIMHHKFKHQNLASSATNLYLIFTLNWLLNFSQHQQTTFNEYKKIWLVPKRKFLTLQKRYQISRLTNNVQNLLELVK